MLLLGCATARTDFHPYSAHSVRAQVLLQAVAASKSDLPALGAAGAVIVGTVEAHGNGFAGADYVAEAIAKEAARHGGTHVVLGVTVEQTARGQHLQSNGGAPNGPGQGAYYPGKTVELTALVLRLPDDVTSWAALPESLQPKPGTRVPGAGASAAVAEPPAIRAPATARAPEPEPAPSDPVEPSTPPVLEPIPPSEAATAPAIVIDGSHIKPLEATETDARPAP